MFGSVATLLSVLAGAQALGQAAREPRPDAPAGTSSPDPRIDADTGRDKRVWPPDLLFDYKHLRLSVNIPNMARAAIRGNVALTAAPIAIARSSMTLDAGPGLSISRVLVGGEAAKFEHDKDAQKLNVQFPKAIERDQDVTVEIDYVGIRPGGGGEGLTFSGDDSRTPEVDFMCHAQGQPQHNHLWFPCHDFPNDRLSVEVIATVPAPYVAVSNGRLLEVRRTPRTGPIEDIPAPDLKAREPNDDATAETFPDETITYHWKQELPHPVYLTTLVVSRFDEVELGGDDSARPGLPMKVYGPLGSGEALRRTFANTPEMVAYFEKLFGVPYPWDKYDQILCRDFAAGAMENTGAVTFAAGLARGRRTGAIDDIISHELVHHWFGDLMTCRSWEHLWLNEGFATFGEALWAEHQRGRTGYLNAIRQNFNSEKVMSRNRSSPRRVGMVGHRYTNPDQRFTSPDNVYQKGGAVLHMLRSRLGDEVFFAGLRDYTRQNMFRQVETDDFRRAMERASGQSLERFFDQWCKRPGHPNLELDYVWTPERPGSEDGAGVLEITVEQKQVINADNPAYAFELPLYASFDGDKSDRDDGQWISVVTDQQIARARFPMSRKPSDIEIDPELTVLASSKVRTKLNQSKDEAQGARSDTGDGADKSEQKSPPAGGAASSGSGQ